MSNFMKKLGFLILTLMSLAAYADDPKNDWHNTTLTEETVKKIQEAKYQYNKCVVDELKSPAYVKQEVRGATEVIIKKCEPSLALMRQVYTEQKVPEVIADRHLKQMRIETTRNVLKQMMFADAIRQSGQNP